MSDVQTIEGRLQAAGRRFAIVAARFNQRIVDPLVKGALDCFARHGADGGELCLVRVPGAWEVPLALEELAAPGDFDALVALAAVIRGETPHFDYICGECSRGVARVAARYRIPIGFGILTCDDSAQAVERAGGKAGNKGWEAAEAAIEMADLKARLQQRGNRGG
jgi:6,7-dimethyl-8-ribityllumazine synthase